MEVEAAILDTTEGATTETLEQTETPTVTVEQLQAQIAATQAEIAKLRADNKNVLKLAGKKDREIQEKEAELKSIRSQDTITKAMLALIEKRTGDTGEDLEDRTVPSLAKEYEAITTKQEQETKAEQLKRQVVEYQQRTEAVLKPTDRQYRIIHRAVVAGDFELADELLSELETAKETNVTTPKAPEPKAELSEADKEKIALEYMKGKGLLKSSPSPSGGAAPQKLDDLIKVNTKGMTQTQLAEHKTKLQAAMKSS